MDRLYTIKQLPLGFIQIFLGFFYLLYGCGIQKVSKQPFDWSTLPTTFPACFSIHAGLIFRTLDQTFRCRLVCSVVYDQHIHFIIKGPLGIEIMRGIIDKKGVILLDRLHRVIHQWDYKRIKQHYHFDGNYLFIQSLLLGTVCNPIKDRRPFAPAALWSSIAYTYDELTGKVIGLQLMDKKQGNRLRLLYQHKMIADKMGLSGIKILFSLKDKEQLYKGNVTLHEFHFKQFKRLNMKLKIPSYYLRR